ncbi:LacI family DNA-binding transcriptional regulator [Agaribacterium haliotis]|uniref:LacI family DNA-binding transcriptional regulator n=1 Tax=Agaribacterium haliotis TaxID=2013869 RepID=UPI000BB544DD|nr:LacI family DNA-binding transcriptional regulator [Agaribacterium haliotis]
MVTIKDVARVAGVSTATVSRVVHDGGKVGDACRARVKKVIEELGYRPNTNARALVSKKSNTVGLVMPHMSPAFFGRLTSGAERAARAQKFRLLVSNSMGLTAEESEAIASFEEHACRAMVLHSKESDEKSLCDLAACHPGLVLINRFVADIAERCVWLDSLAGARQITEFLLEKGHRRFAIASSSAPEEDAVARVAGATQILEEAGIVVEEKDIVRTATDLDGGAEVGRRLLERGVDFSALICHNDMQAVGAMNVLQDAGIAVPEQLSIVGFDNLYVSSACRPRLTTMTYPIEEMANYAIELAIKLADGQQAPAGRTHLFMPRIEERDSVADLN